MCSNAHILLSLICLSLLCNCIKSSSPDLKPLALTCGNKDGGTDSDGRKWESDAKYLVSADKSVEAVAQFQDPSLTSQIPYMNGRFFTSETTYKFPIIGTSRYFLRFHFYPSSYPNFNTTNSYFSVVAGGVTLLNNFSAVIAAQALTQAYIMKEFSLASLNSDSLSVTFMPSDKYNGSFAFVNGIEVMPSPNLFDSASMVGFEDQPLDTSSSHVQTMWRLNVGGQYIPPTNDSSSLARSWYDDTPYIYSGALGVTSQAENNVTIAYKNISTAIAPVEVYQTSRQMGLDGNVTRNNINERVFNIYINNQTAMEDADVLAWSGGPGIPIYKDYAIYVPEASGDEMLWLALWPDNTMLPEYFDAILNGLEIFKLSDTNSNLAGPNPTISDMMQKQLQEAAKRPFENQGKKTYTTALIGGAAGGAAAFAFVAVAFKSTISGKSHGGTTISSDAAANCRYFSLGEIQHATKNFDESNVIGVGGFGKVYKGIIDGDTKVAIKRSNPSSEQGVNEFQTEIEMLSKLRHRHLVSLIGFCEDNGEMILVYDYMGHGTLREHLYKGNKITLSWKQRPALNPSLPKEQVSLADWALHCQRKGTLEDIVDPQLKGKISPECLKKFAELAEKCLADHGTDRPSMGDVLWNLEFALQMQENPERSSRKPTSGSVDYDQPEEIDHSSFLAMHRSTLSLGSEHDEKESEGGPDDIFSQIVNPKGR
ncbi:malectin/receptor-like protein kinase family protein [Actinidia rufa]|uniref:Malectin/receptor-like protein kinase family protein n=1 Tax=Actinidia rufa TaxID=165716 RepID=A0A7J0GSQ7_9ERIC|nr:malectin/receptor-like protein kinase family protein [Actinidia rufa]